jgi:hypothetical protein
MKKPTLRLRQVFEGPTHFKVVRPLGNPIKIAKQGLSPNLMGRLRKFAREGEVQEATEQDAQNTQDLMDEMAGAGGDAPSGRPRPRRITKVAGIEDNPDDAAPPAPTIPADYQASVMREAALFEDPTQRADFIKNAIKAFNLSREYDASAIADEPAVEEVAPSTRPRPRPGMVVQSGRPRPRPEEAAAARQAQEMLVTDAQPVNVVERVAAQPIEVIKSQSVPVKLERVVAGSLMGRPAPVAPVMKPAPVMSVDEEMLAGYQRDLDLERSKAKPNPDEIKLLEDAIKQTNEAIAVASAAPAPKASPVAPAAAVAPTPAPVVAPAAAPVAPTPAVAVAPAAAVAPVAAPAAVAPPAAVKPAELTPEQLFNKRLADVGLDRTAYDKMTPLQKMAAQGLVRQAAALEAQTTADEEMVQGEIKAQQDIIDKEKERLNTLETRANESRDLQKKILEEMDHLKNPQSYFASLGTLGSIGSALSLAAGAFASGMTGMPNYAMQIFNNAVEKDLELQKMKRDSLFARLRDAGHSVESAEEVVRASARLVASAQAGKLAAMTKLPKVKASLALEQAKLTNDAIMKMAQVAEIEARPGERAAERDIRRQQMAESGARAAAAAEERRLAREQREALAEQKRLDAQAERMVNVGDEDLELRTKTGSTGIRKELSGRIAALQAAIKLEELFKEGGYEIFNPLSPRYRGEAIAEVPMLIEQYPGGKGFQRAISLNAGKFLKEALQDPTSVQALAKKFFADRDPSVGIKALRDDFQRGYVDAVRNYVREPASKRTTEAIKREIQRAREVVSAEDVGVEGFVFSPLSAPAAAPATPIGVPPGGNPPGMR